MNESTIRSRYRRQTLLPEIGIAGQEKLGRARVLVVGAGGLGCPVLQYLAAAGVGHIGIVDGDRVEASNLHRQVLYGTNDLGFLKVDAAAAALHRLNPHVAVQVYPLYLHNEAALTLLPEYDIVVDGTDNFATRYLLNDACALLQKPLVFAALSQWEGQLAVLHVAGETKQGLNYRDIFPEPPGPDEVPNCAEAGVLGVLPGIIGTLQAAEVIKWITGTGVLVSNGLLCYNLKTASSWLLEVVPSQQQYTPQNREAFLHYNYEWLCSDPEVTEIGSSELPLLLAKGALFIDVRETYEKPDLPVPHLRLPLSVLRSQRQQLTGNEVVVVCHHGVRSIEAVRILGRWAPAGQNLYSLKGGVMALSAVVQNESK